MSDVETQDLHAGIVATLAACLRVTGMHDQAREPGIEPARVPQRGQIAPGAEQRLLRRVLRAMHITQDAVGQGEAAIGVGAHQRGERILVASTCVFHELALHEALPARGIVAPSASMGTAAPDSFIAPAGTRAGRGAARQHRPSPRSLVGPMRLSTLFFTTLRDDPSEAEMPSHRLLLRAGYVRQLGAGIYSLLPLGFRVKRRVEQVIREELDAIGGQEMEMPVVHPAELWRETGRYDAIGPEMAPLQGPSGPGHGAGDDPRGGGGGPAAGHHPELSAAARHHLPLPDQVPRRAALRAAA